MKKILIVFCVFMSAVILHVIRADEGMWIPLLIEKYNIELMREKGFRLSAEDIYSVNRACMKDAIVLFGGGCTGEMISPDGLLLTNHHCGYGNIQRHSSLENDYLTEGFWAMSRKDELPNPGLSVTFLRYMEDVTDRTFFGISDSMSRSEKELLIRSNIELIQYQAEKESGLQAQVKPFYMGNQYFLIVSETFRDVRLVGAPPSAIGRFGGETDNWVWPRHTGDFSLFRVYAGKDNKPADFSDENVPYKPLYYFPVSLKGVKEGDFTMVFGYPGSTVEYMPSFYIDMIKNYVNPKMIAVRTEKIEIMEKAMNSDPLVRIQYSAKKSGIANSWKKWIGEIQGLERMNTIAEKQEFEARFTEWIGTDEVRRVQYGHILPAYKKLYAELKDYYIAYNLTNETINSIEAVNLASGIRVLDNLIKSGASANEIEKTKADLIGASKSFFRNYDKGTDMKLFVSLMKIYGEMLGSEWLIHSYLNLKNAFKGDFEVAGRKTYDQSVFVNESEFVDFIKGYDKSASKKISRDPFYTMATEAWDFLSNKIRPEIIRINGVLAELHRDYMKAQMEFDSGRVFYPDANSSLRVSYGNVKGYFAKDAVYYTHSTTLKGIIEKDNPEIYDYDVPDRLKELYYRNDFGRYGSDGELSVCFIADNHTTGGNSGSPVINADGHLIGINFDRAWEGVASDMDFNPEQSRNISVDVRYILFIIDKLAGAGYLLDELTIIE
jgi:hypothetical protein